MKSDFHVKEKINKVYKETGCLDMEDYDRYKLESETWRTAVKKLEPGDRFTIKSFVKNAGAAYEKGGRVAKIKNFGEMGALKLMAKLGIWMNEVGYGK